VLKNHKWQRDCVCFTDCRRQEIWDGLKHCFCGNLSAGWTVDRWTQTCKSWSFRGDRIKWNVLRQIAESRCEVFPTFQRRRQSLKRRENFASWSGCLTENDSWSANIASWYRTSCFLLSKVTWTPSGFGGLVVSMLASGTQDRGFAPGRSRRIFSFGREVKPFAPCRRIAACQRTL
jgi:hypothetical protein